MNPSVTIRTIQASEAKTHFLRILDEVERGQTITVTRHGRAVARIVPEEEPYEEIAKRAIAGIRAIHKNTKHISVEQILADRDEGRK